MNPQKQDTIYEEIQSVLEETDGIIDHETIHKMEYLEAAIEEDLRAFPPVMRYLYTLLFYYHLFSNYKSISFISS